MPPQRRRRWELVVVLQRNSTTTLLVVKARKLQFEDGKLVIKQEHPKVDERVPLDDIRELSVLD